MSEFNWDNRYKVRYDEWTLTGTKFNQCSYFKSFDEASEYEEMISNWSFTINVELIDLFKEEER